MLLLPPTACRPNHLATMADHRRRLLEQLSGRFSNEAQALANPPLFAAIQVALRPVPHLTPGSLLLEQAYTLQPERPYRIRVLEVGTDSRGLIIRNHALANEERFHGATASPEQLATLSTEDLQLLEGCTYLVESSGNSFRGEVEPGGRCRVQRSGQESYLVSSFEVGEGWFRSSDQGFDPVTHTRLWGSVAGPFVFERVQSFAAELPPGW